MKQNFSDTSELKFIDLFAGIGGFRIALEKFGFECVYSNEWDKHAQITYKENFGEIPCGDITKVDPKDVPEHHILCAGFPCQAFSISGKQRGFDDARGTLFFDIVRIVNYHKPEILFLENVKNFTKHDNGNTFAVIKNILDDLNYDVFYKILNASDFGCPTARERVYILGFRKDLKIKHFDFPNPMETHTKLKDYLEDDDLTSKYIIDRADIKLCKTEVFPDIFDSYPQKPIRIGTINKGGQGERIYHEMGHAITLSAYGGGVASKTGAYLVNNRVRKLTPRECARIMGYPDSYKIPVSDSQAYKQFGNSVAIPVLVEIVRKVIDTISNNG